MIDVTDQCKFLLISQAPQGKEVKYTERYTYSQNGNLMKGRIYLRICMQAEFYGVWAKSNFLSSRKIQLTALTKYVPFIKFNQ